MFCQIWSRWCLWPIFKVPSETALLLLLHSPSPFHLGMDITMGIVREQLGQTSFANEKFRTQKSKK